MLEKSLYLALFLLYSGSYLISIYIHILIINNKINKYNKYNNIIYTYVPIINKKNSIYR